MARKVGSVEFDVDFDGKTLPAQARKIGEEAGTTLGKGIGDGARKSGFDKTISRQFDRITPSVKRLGDSLRDVTVPNGLDRDITRVGRSLSWTKEATGDVTLLGDRLDKAWESFKRGGAATERARQRSIAFRKSWIDLGDTLAKGSNWRGALSRIAALDDGVKKLNVNWRNLSANTRQWTLIIGAVMTAGADIAGLGSMVGEGVFAAAGAVTALGTAAYATGAIFVNLTQDISKAPAAMKPAIQSFLNFKSALGQVNDAIALAAFPKLDGAFKSLRTTLLGIGGPLADMGAKVGDVGEAFAKSIAPGTENFLNLRKVISDSVPLFGKIADASGTWLSGLLRGIMKAMPAANQLVGWVDTLGNRFDAFTRSNRFDLWVATMITSWTHFGSLLDAAGRLLNNLVTPESLGRLNNFMDNLTAFMPNLEALLANLGKLDLFGLAAQALNELGAALQPLAKPAGELFEALNRVASISLTAIADAIGGIATALVPVVQLAADFLNAIPPEWIAQAATAVTVLAAAFVVLNAANGLVGAVSNLKKFGGAMLDGLGLSEQLTASLKGGLKSGLSVLSKAGMIGAVIGGVAVASTALKDLSDKIRGIAEASREAVTSGASIQQSYDNLGKSAFGMSYQLTNASGALDMLSSVGTGVDKAFGTFVATFSDTGRQASQLAATLSNLDAPLAQMAQNNLPAAQQQFAAYATQLGASQKQTMAMLEQMPEFTKALTAAGEATGQVVDDQALYEIAMNGATAATKASEAATQANNAALDVLSGKANDASGEISDLAAKIKGFGSASLTTRDAARDFQSAIIDATKSVQENGKSLDITTAAGNANQATLDRIAKSSLAYSGALLEQTGSESKARDAIQQGRDALIKQLAQYGITGAAAKKYADNLGLIPDNVQTAVSLTGVKDAENDLAYLSRTRTVRLNVVSGQSQGHGVNDPRFASGGILYGPRRIVAGEAGREALVPLDRPLSMVSPSVRALSAYARGLVSLTSTAGRFAKRPTGGTPRMASGGVLLPQSTRGASSTAAPDGPRVVFEAGSIVVQGSSDPNRTANEVVRRMIEKVAG